MIKEAACVAEDIDNRPEVDIAKVIIIQFKQEIRKKGVSSAIERVYLSQRNHKEDFPDPFIEVFYKLLCRSVEELYTIEGHTLTVKHGKDSYGPYVKAECSSGDYAEWHIDSECNVFEGWDSWKREARI